MIYRLIMEGAAILAICLYSIITMAFIISSFLISLTFIAYIHKDKEDFLYFILHMILITGHYIVMIICMTCTTRTTKISDFIFIKLLRCPFYIKIKQASKLFKTLSLTVHFFHLVYFSSFLKKYYDIGNR